MRKSSGSTRRSDFSLYNFCARSDGTNRPELIRYETRAFFINPETNVCRTIFTPQRPCKLLKTHTPRSSFKFSTMNFLWTNIAPPLYLYTTSITFIIEFSFRPANIRKYNRTDCLAFDSNCTSHFEKQLFFIRRRKRIRNNTHTKIGRLHGTNERCYANISTKCFKCFNKHISLSLTCSFHRSHERRFDYKRRSGGSLAIAIHID